MTYTISSGQNQNLSQGVLYDGEPYITINPYNSQHMVVAWLGYKPFQYVIIKTKTTFNGGQSWSNTYEIPHTNPLYGSADPSLAFDNTGNVFLSYIDYDIAIDSGSVYVRKSTDGGLSWGAPIEVINAHSDPGKYPIDRPWISIDRSGGTYDGYIYVTTMNPNVFGPLTPPYYPYFIRSTNSGASFEPWRHLDTVGWLAGSIIPTPMPSPSISSNGTFHAIYPSWEPQSQNILPQYIIASSVDAGNSFNYKSALILSSVFIDSSAKKASLFRADPSDDDHLCLFYLGIDYGDADVLITESYDNGVSWSNSLRINDDPISNNRMQDLVWADFDIDGDLLVTWRDRRNGADSTYATDSEIYGAIRWKDSVDFSTNFRISDTIIAYDTILEAKGNDFMCTVFLNDTLNAVWGDNRDGNVKIWFHKMAINGTTVSIHELSNEILPEIKIFPNPTFSVLKIIGENITQIDVCNQEGKILLTKKYSNQKIPINLFLDNLSDGLYFLHIKTSLGNITKKVIKN